jgi:hypothetical protein
MTDGRTTTEVASREHPRQGSDDQRSTTVRTDRELTIEIIPRTEARQKSDARRRAEIDAAIAMVMLLNGRPHEEPDRLAVISQSPPGSPRKTVFRVPIRAIHKSVARGPRWSLGPKEKMIRMLIADAVGSIGYNPFALDAVTHGIRNVSPSAATLLLSQ